MLICPQCEFENPEENKFCQSCGVSLTHKVCCQCGTDIPIEAKICENCGAANHTVLWAIISQSPTSEQLNSEPELAQISATASNSSQLEIASLADLFANSQSKSIPALQLQGEVDTEQTYHRYAIKSEDNAVGLYGNANDCYQNTFLQGKVIDQYPLQKSHLAILQKQQMDLFAEFSHSQIRIIQILT